MKLNKQNKTWIIVGVIIAFILFIANPNDIFSREASYKTGYNSLEICQNAKIYYSQFCDLTKDCFGYVDNDVQKYAIHFENCPMFGDGTSERPSTLNVGLLLSCTGEFTPRGYIGGTCSEAPECVVNNDCNFDEYCDNSECFMLDCGSNEEIENHQCIPIIEDENDDVEPDGNGETDEETQLEDEDYNYLYNWAPEFLGLEKPICALIIVFGVLLLLVMITKKK